MGLVDHGNRRSASSFDSQVCSHDFISHTFKNLCFNEINDLPTRGSKRLKSGKWILYVNVTRVVKYCSSWKHCSHELSLKKTQRSNYSGSTDGDIMSSRQKIRRKYEYWRPWVEFLVHLQSVICLHMFFFSETGHEPLPMSLEAQLVIFLGDDVGFYRGVTISEHVGITKIMTFTDRRSLWHYDVLSYPPSRLLGLVFPEIDLGFFNLQRWFFFAGLNKKGSCSFQCLVPPLRLWNVSWTSPRRSWTMLVTRAEKSPKISMLVSKSQAILHGMYKKPYQIQDFLRPGDVRSIPKLGPAIFFWELGLQFYCSEFVASLLYVGMGLQVFREWIHFVFCPQPAHYSQAKVVIP